MSAVYRGPIVVKDRSGVDNEISNLVPLIGYVSEDGFKLSDIHIAGIHRIAPNDEQQGSIAILFDPKIAPWKSWYIAVIVIVKSYYSEKFAEVREVVHHTAPFIER